MTYLEAEDDWCGRFTAAGAAAGGCCALVVDAERTIGCGAGLGACGSVDERVMPGGLLLTGAALGSDRMDATSSVTSLDAMDTACEHKGNQRDTGGVQPLAAQLLPTCCRLRVPPYARLFLLMPPYCCQHSKIAMYTVQLLAVCVCTTPWSWC